LEQIMVKIDAHSIADISSTCHLIMFSIKGC